MSVSSWSSVPRSPPGFAWSNTQSGEPDAGCQLPPKVNDGGTLGLTLSLTSPSVSRSESKIPSYGGTHQERHLHAVRLERRSGVTRIVAPAELPLVMGDTVSILSSIDTFEPILRYFVLILLYPIFDSIDTVSLYRYAN